MAKQIIAVDIDDVLSESATGFLKFSNEQFGTDFDVSDYVEDWAKLWQIDHDQVLERVRVHHAKDIASGYESVPHSFATLSKLSESYTLVAITSRRSEMIPSTATWLGKHYPNIFSKVQHAGIFDGEALHQDMQKATKKSLFADNNVSIVIDDQPKHIFAAAELGLEALLFGDYSWNQVDTLPAGVTRCADWKAVEQYFDARR